MFEAEFEAVILAAGRGSRLADVLDHTPKCLLPVGPFPVIWYPLNLLQKHGFLEATVVVLDTEASIISEAISATKLKIKPIYKIVSSEEYGTADSIRMLYDGRRVKSDLLVLSCDLVTNTSLIPLINKFRETGASVVALLFENDMESGLVLPGPKIKRLPESDLIGIQPETDRLLMLTSVNDFEKNVPVDAKILNENRKMRMSTKLLDGHCYILRKWVPHYLKSVPHISTLKGEFLPHIIKKQKSRMLLQIPNPESSPDVSQDQQIYAIPQIGVEISLSELIKRSEGKFNLQPDSLYSGPRSTTPVRCFAVAQTKDVVGIRVNTVPRLNAVNQQLAQIWPLIIGNQEIPAIAPSAVIASTQMENIFVGLKAKLSEKTSLRNSVFGTYSVVEPKTVVTNSVVLTSAVIDEGCKIENCIIGEYAHIYAGCQLKNCIVIPRFSVAKGTKAQAVLFSPDTVINNGFDDDED